MILRCVRALAAAVLLLGALPSIAGAAGRTPTELLFESKHFEGVPVGTVLTYRYDRRSADPARLGGDFSDDISMTIGAGEAPGERSVAVEMFTGARRRPAGPFPAMIGNPLLILFLEADVGAMEKLVGGNPRYLKNRIRAAFREAGTAEPTKVTIDGVEHDAEKVTLKPFAGDEHRRELGAFVEKTYEFVVSDSVPGGLVELKTFTPKLDKPGEPFFEEEIHFVGAKPAKG
jgi:hypothetical protein